jgi:multidrug resistance efflux pump
VAVIAGTSGAYFHFRNPNEKRADLVTYKVHPDRLELTIVERGTLESAKNIDVYCNVKSGARGGATSASTSIKWVIDDGSSVKNGDLLVDLDDSGLQDQLKNQKIAVDNAEADKVKAEEDYKIQELQNESDMNTARVNQQLAEIDLDKYMNGDYPQALKDVQGRIKVAEGDVEQQRERAAWANRMVKKGYYTVTQSQAEQSKLESCELALGKVKEEERVLNDDKYGLKKRTETDLRNKLEQAKLAVKTVDSQAKAKEAQARSIREAKKSVWAQAVSQYKDLEEEIKKCKIYAKQDGMVVYYIPEQARGGGGTQQSIVAQGEPVREGQKLMQIPDLKRMMVNTKVHEALVSRVKAGQPARIRVDSFPDNILKGKIDSVATVSSSQDFFSSDVKVYATKVRIQGHAENLKPGMSAEVTITVGATLENILTVPIQAIVGGVELGKQRKCFVLTPDGPQERDIVIGESNERMAEVKEGLHEGDDVVLNPRALIGDKMKTRDAPPDRHGKGAEAKPSDDGGKAGKKDRPAASPDEKRQPSGSGPGGQFSPEEKQKQMEKFRQASPEERKKMLEQVPEEFREKLKSKLQEQGLEVK